MSKKARRRPSWKHKNPAYRYNYFVIGGRRIWIAKKKIVARKRALKADWTIEIAQDIQPIYGDDILLQDLYEDLIDNLS